MKEGGTDLHKTIRKINLVYKGLRTCCQHGLQSKLCIIASRVKSYAKVHSFYLKINSRISLKWETDFIQ